MNNILILFLPMLHPPDPIITFILFESRPLPVWAGLSALRKSLASRGVTGMPAKPDPANFEIHLMPASKNLSNAILSLFKCRQLAGIPAS